MFITRVNKSVEYSWHLADNSLTTLCGRYKPTRDSITEEMILTKTQVNFKEFMRSVCKGKISDLNICQHCIERYKKNVLFI